MPRAGGWSGEFGAFRAPAWLRSGRFCCFFAPMIRVGCVRWDRSVTSGAA
jgi:hypothetical protein